VTNPFDDPEGRFLVLRNGAGQYSLWPARVDAPAGWTVDHAEDGRDACLRHIETVWTDLRPHRTGPGGATASGEAVGAVPERRP
jgi:MbtH protein